MGYTKDQLDKLAKAMREMPDAAHTREHSKSEAVRILSREIAMLQKKGYTLQQVGETLKSGGLEITTETLKNYMQRNKAISKSNAGRAGAQRPVRKTALPKKQLGTAANDTEPGSDYGEVGIWNPTSDPQILANSTPLGAVTNGMNQSKVTPAHQRPTINTRPPERMGTFVVSSDSSSI